MAWTPQQIYKLGAESLGWNNSTDAGKALIAEDMALLKRLQQASPNGGWPSPAPQRPFENRICNNIFKNLEEINFLNKF